MQYKICLLTLVISAVSGYVDIVIPDNKKVFDLDLYKDVLDPQQCLEQTQILANNTVLLSLFLDAGIRTPRGIHKGNLVDMGNYYQCLEINENVANTNIHGKYCTISVPLEQDINWPSLPEWELPWPNITFPENITWPELPLQEITSLRSRLSKETIEEIKRFKLLVTGARGMSGLSRSSDVRSSGDSSLLDSALNLAICIPKPCTTHEALSNLLVGFEYLGLEFTELACRLPNDKKWVPADYTAIVIFSILGVLAVVSTGYDIRHTIILKRDPKSANKLYQSFSVYTNTRRLLTFTPVPGALDCLDGVRALAMIWVIIGHTFVNQLSGLNMANPLDTINWMMTYEALWITAAPITVDTFFMISGLLVVYSTAGKMTRMKFVKNIHLFYLNRLLRLFPVLAAAILLQVSLFSRVTDGPFSELVVRHTEACRTYWWTTLLYIQNFYNPTSMCFPHSWYLAIDFHMFLVSPVILFWVVSGKRRAAWLAVWTGLLAALIGSAIYNFTQNFASATISLSRLQDQNTYMYYYYVNTLTRCSPFFVGMIYGYLLHTYRDKKVYLSKVQAGILWILTFAILIGVIFITRPIMQVDWDNQLADNFINTFKRPLWALGVGWLVFACSKGYGGPITWVLCLGMWKLLGRLSYAMYIIHYPIIFIINSTSLAPVPFSVESSFHRFSNDFLIAVVGAFLITLLVDSPCSTLIKIMMGSGPKRPPPAKQANQLDGVKNDVEIVINDREVVNKTAL